MVRRVFLGVFPQTSCLYSASRLNLPGRNGFRSYSTAEIGGSSGKVNLKEMQDLSFEQFKKTKVKSFEVFKQSPRVQFLFGNDIEKVSKAYEDDCVCKYNRFRLVEHGGNPATIL